MAAGDDGVEQQLIQQLDALIDEGPADDELAAARGRRTLMDELLRKSPRVARKVAARSCSTRRPGSRLPKARRHSPPPTVKPLWRSEGASPRIAPRWRRRNLVQRVHPGSHRWACRRVRRQCRASSRRELHRAWHQPMAEALFCSTRHPGWRRKGLLFGLRRRSPKGPRRALRRLAEARFCSTRVRELPRMGPLHQALEPRLAAHRVPIRRAGS